MVNIGNRRKEGRRLIGDESSDAPGSQVWRDSGSLSQIGACIFCTIPWIYLCIPGPLRVRWYSLVLVYARTGFQTIVGINRE